MHRDIKLVYSWFLEFLDENENSFSSNPNVWYFMIRYFSKFTNSTSEFIFMYFLKQITYMIRSCAFGKSNFALSDSGHVWFGPIQLKTILHKLIQ